MDKQYGDLGGKVFFIWGTTCACCSIFAFIFVPETKGEDRSHRCDNPLHTDFVLGLTLEQVDKMMEEVNPIQSSKWRMHDTFMHEMGSGGGRERRPFSIESQPHQSWNKDMTRTAHDRTYSSER